MKIEVTINGFKKYLEAEPGELLVDVLRREGYVGVKKGCDDGSCGACTILMNHRAINACLVLAGQAKDKAITTIEGLGTLDKPHVLQEAFVDAGAVQCGYCTPGMILSAYALLEDNPSPDRKDILKALDGNLCRCTGYVKIVEAVQTAAAKLK